MIYKPNIPEYTPFNPVTPLPWLVTEEVEEAEEITPPVETTYVQQEEEKQEPEKPDIYTTDTKDLNNQQFVALMTQVYTEVLKEHNIPTEYARYLVAQDALESGGGKRKPNKYNLGGIKYVGSDNNYTTNQHQEYINGNYITQTGPFRNFANLKEFAEYKVKLLLKPRYNAFTGDPTKFFERVKNGGYATAPDYVTTLTSMLNSVSSYKDGGAIEPKEKTMGWFDRASAKIAALWEDAGGFFIPESFIKAYLKNNLAEVSMKVDPDALDQFGEGISGAFIPALKQIILRDPSNAKTIFHELAHSAKNQPAVQRIKQIFADLGDKAFNNGYSFDSYLDDPGEIYARYLAYVLTADHDPRKVMTPADIAQLQHDPQGENTVFTDWQLPNGEIVRTEYTTHDGKPIVAEPRPLGGTYVTSKAFVASKDDSNNLGNRYSPQFLSRLFNEVAMNTSQPKSDAAYAKSGLKLNAPKTKEFIRATNSVALYNLQNNRSFPEFGFRLFDDNSNIEVGEYNGDYIVYPAIQNINGEFVDLNAIPYRYNADFANAIETENYVIAPDKATAEDFVKNYKQYENLFPKHQELIDEQGNKVYSVPKTQQVKDVYNHLISLGATPVQAAGITGSLFQESGLDHSKVNKTSGAKGIAQLIGARQTEYEKGLNRQTDTADTGQNQLTWIGNKIHNEDDDWHNYYLALKDKVDNNQPLNETEARHWNSMKDSQYINYSFKDFADKTKRMSSPTVVAEWFTNTFERPLDKDKKYTQRGYYAEQIYNMFNPYNNFLWLTEQFDPSVINY